MHYEESINQVDFWFDPNTEFIFWAWKCRFCTGRSYFFFFWKFILKIIIYNLDFISPWKQSYNWRSGRLDPQMLITYSQLLIIYTSPLKWFLFSYCHCLLWWQHLGALLWIECVLGDCPGNLTILEGKGFSVEQQDETMVTCGSHEMLPVIKKEHGVTRGILVLLATTSWLMIHSGKN